MIWHRMFPAALLLVLMQSGSPARFSAAFQGSCPEPESLKAQVIRTIRRSAPGFTEGLVYRNGLLFESTGGYGASALNRIDLSDGRVTEIARLPSQWFGEGLDFWNGFFLQLTWKEGKAIFWRNEPSPELVTIRAYPREGWGLTHGRGAWIASDGTAKLYFLDPVDLREEGSVEARLRENPVRGLNELEEVNGKILANVFPTDLILRIQMGEKGCVDGVLDLSTLRSYFSHRDFARVSKDPESVANGIAYDPEQRVLYVTGKNWPLIFKLKWPN